MSFCGNFIVIYLLQTYLSIPYCVISKLCIPPLHTGVLTVHCLPDVAMASNRKAVLAQRPLPSLDPEKQAVVLLLPLSSGPRSLHKSYWTLLYSSGNDKSVLHSKLSTHQDLTSKTPHSLPGPRTSKKLSCLLTPMISGTLWNSSRMRMFIGTSGR